MARQAAHTAPLNAAGEIAERDDSCDPAHEVHELLDAIARLPDHERLVISLRYFDARSIAEVAELTGRPVGTVTKQLSRAIARLTLILKEFEP
jgi:RNA polymerase sigma-70 factor (ECF subfamily)